MGHPDWQSGVNWRSPLYTVGPLNVPGNAGIDLTPITPSPVAGFAICTYPAYTLQIQAQSNAAETVNPFLKVTVFFYNDDSLTANVVDQIQWFIGEGLAAPATTLGKGPLRGVFCKVRVVNTSALAATLTSFSMAGTNHLY